GWPLGVESQYPIPHRLQPDTADPGGLGARPAVIDRRQRQQAPGLSGILRPLRQHAYLRGLVIPANSNRSRHGKPLRVCHGESYSPRLGNPPRVSLVHWDLVLVLKVETGLQFYLQLCALYGSIGSMLRQSQGATVWTDR